MAEVGQLNSAGMFGDLPNGRAAAAEPAVAIELRDGLDRDPRDRQTGREFPEALRQVVAAAAGNGS